MMSKCLKPLRSLDLAWLFGAPTALNAFACKVAIPLVDAWNIFPIEVTYFACVGVLVLVPMFFWALHLTAREIASSRMRDILARMRSARSSRFAWHRSESQRS